MGELGGTFGTFGGFSEFELKPVGALGDWRIVRSSGEVKATGEMGSRRGGVGGVEVRVMGEYDGARRDWVDGFLAGDDIVALLFLCALFQGFASTFYFPPEFLCLSFAELDTG